MDATDIAYALGSLLVTAGACWYSPPAGLIVLGACFLVLAGLGIADKRGTG